jgi:hypothetical protein
VKECRNLTYAPEAENAKKLNCQEVEAKFTTKEKRRQHLHVSYAVNLWLESHKILLLKFANLTGARGEFGVHLADKYATTA